MPSRARAATSFGNRYFRCWDKKGHGDAEPRAAIEKSCDVYFYQLGLSSDSTRLLAGGVDARNARAERASTCPNEKQPLLAVRATAYFDRKYGPSGWSNGDAAEPRRSVRARIRRPSSNMARFYTALATDGCMRRGPRSSRARPERTQIIQAHARADGRVCSARWPASCRRAARRPRRADQGVVLAGKTGTAQNGTFRNGIELNHAWFVWLRAGGRSEDRRRRDARVRRHGSVAARIASKIIEHYLKAADRSRARSWTG